MNEAILVTTFNRPELLYVCLKRLRAVHTWIPIYVFPDRGTHRDERLQQTCKEFSANIHFIPSHDYYGNTYNTMEAYRWAYNSGFDLTYLIEDDVMVHGDFFSWHHQQHEDFSDIFASMGWILNHHAPITEDVLFHPWYYSIGCAFRREKLALIVEHASPRYYADLVGYIGKNFKNNLLNNSVSVAHVEQDGLIQRVMMEDRSQTVSPCIAKCTHAGFMGYNRGWRSGDDIFKGAESFEERVQRVEEFIADPYWRMQYFGRAIVEREEGHEIGERKFRYRMIQGEWESDFVSELFPHQFPKKINSTLITPETKFVLVSA